MAQSRIGDFILDAVAEHPNDLITFAGRHFGLSRQAIHRHVQALVQRGLIHQTGETRAVTYTLKVLKSYRHTYDTAGLQESVVWHDDASSVVSDLPENVRAICQHGLTEMVNNAIDHSGSPTVTVRVMRTARDIMITVADAGIGIFAKIRQQWNLDDERHAMLELSKGKLTTDPSRHSGEGIFFSSRMFDSFEIRSGSFTFAHFIGSDDWLFDGEPNAQSGTLVAMNLKIPTERTVREVFDAYADEHHDYGFTRTHLYIGLGRYEGEQLISRSQAKRLLARMERFREVQLDFKGVDSIGQAFADEMFRVYPSHHPGIKFEVANATSDVSRMIRRARSEGANAQPTLIVTGVPPLTKKPGPLVRKSPQRTASKKAPTKKLAAGKSQAANRRVKAKTKSKSKMGRSDRGDR